MQSAKQGGIEYYFLSLSYDWTPDFRTIDEHSTTIINITYIQIYGETYSRIKTYYLVLVNNNNKNNNNIWTDKSGKILRLKHQ